MMTRPGRSLTAEILEDLGHNVTAAITLLSTEEDSIFCCQALLCQR